MNPLLLLAVAITPEIWGGESILAFSMTIFFGTTLASANEGCDSVHRQSYSYLEASETKNNILTPVSVPSALVASFKVAIAGSHSQPSWEKWP